MEKYKKGDNVTVYWNDAVIYGKQNISYSKKLKPTKTITEGKLVEKNEEYVVIGSPKTFVYKVLQKKYIPKPSESGEKITFFLIPTGMIEKIVRPEGKSN
ncbi:MAG: hypothetical protein V1656_02440 [Candidatus Jorgensenbacteria bacterium]